MCCNQPPIYRGTFHVLMDIFDTAEWLFQVLAWVSVGIMGGLFWKGESEYFKWALFSTIFCTAFAVDFLGRWVPKRAMWELEDHNLLLGTSTFRLAAWILWGSAALSDVHVLWAIGGACWLLHGCGMIYYVFDNQYDTLFGEKGDKRFARRMFRVVLHDVVSGFLVVLLGATLEDVFDGDADDSQWRSLFSGAVIFQLFFVLWHHFDQLHVDRSQRCCSEKMRIVWRVFIRFLSFGGLLLVLLIRAHEDRVLVDMGIDDLSFGIFVASCGILLLTSQKSQ